MATRSRGRSNGVTIFKRTLHTRASSVGRGINRGGVKHTVNFPGVTTGRKFGSNNQAVKVRKGRR